MPETIKPNVIILQSGTNKYEIPITGQVLSYSGFGDFLIIAGGPEIDLRLAARSYNHSLGGGNYFLTCCQNELLEKFTGGQYFIGIEDGTVNTTPKQKGTLTITNINSQGYWGGFSFIGQNAVGEEKEFTGRFRVVY